MTPTRFRIGNWTVQPTEGVIECEGERRHLRPKAMDFLLLLAETPGITVEKQTIFGRLWPETVVEEGALARCVSELRAALDDSAQKPRFIQTRHRRGYRLIASVEPVQVVLEQPVRKVESVRPRRMLLLGAALVAGLATVAVSAFLRSDERVSTSTLGGFPSDRFAMPRVVVLGATHLDGDARHAWIGRAVAHLLTAELASTTSLRLVPADVSGRSEGALAIARSETLPPEALAQLRQRFGVDLVVSGHYVVAAGENDDLRLDLMVTDAGNGEICSAVVEHGPSDRLSQIVSLAVMRLREDLDLPTLIPAGIRGSSAVEATPSQLPPSYFQGLLLLDRLEAQAARERFEQAITVAPSAVWPRLALAESWSLLGYDHNAAEAVAEARVHAGVLDGEERLWFDSRAHALSTDWDGAIERFRALRLLEPNNLEYSLALLATLVEAGRMADARDLIEHTENGEPTVNARFEGDPRWSLLQGEVVLTMGNRRGALEAARAAYVRSRGLQAPAVEARALLLKARALHADGEVEEASATLEAARLRFELIRDRSGEAQATLAQARWMSRRGEHERAVATTEAALAISREVGDRSGEGTALRILGSLVWQLEGRESGEAHLRKAIDVARETGDRDGEAAALSDLAIAFARFSTGEPSMPHFREALAINRDLGNRKQVGASLMNIGKLALLIGDFETSRTSYEEAEAVVDDLDPRSRGMIAFNLGYLRALTNDAAGARRSFEQALALFRRLNDVVMADASLEALASAALVAGDFELALEHIRTTLRLREERGELARIARAKVVLSRVLLASGQTTEAEHVARQALEETQVEAASLVRPTAVEAVALVLLEAGRFQEAGRVIDEVVGLIPDRFGWPSLNIAIYDLTRTRIDAALGRHAEALDRANALRAYFEDRGAGTLVVEADYVLLELDFRRLGRLDQDRAKALVKTARATGQELIALRVEALGRD